MISMDELSSLAHALTEADRAVEAAEEELKRRKEFARVLREETLPCAMQELNLTNITLSTGEKIGMKQEVYVSIPVARKEEAFSWLESNGFGGLIKTVVSLQFGKGELQAAQDTCDQLNVLGFDPEMKRDVNAQTLKAWAREQLTEGREFPMDLFGARPVWTATVK